MNVLSTCIQQVGRNVVDITSIPCVSARWSQLCRSDPLRIHRTCRVHALPQSTIQEEYSLNDSYLLVPRVFLHNTTSSPHEHNNITHTVLPLVQATRLQYKRHTTGIHPSFQRSILSSTRTRDLSNTVLVDNHTTTTNKPHFKFQIDSYAMFLYV